MTVEILHGDCLSVLPTLEAGSFSACLTDPPYHLQSIHARFAAKGRDETSERYAAGPYGRHAKGFMGKQWDGGDVAFRPETWAAVHRALKPGAHLLAMGGTRTFHRLACAIEDAGFEIRDTIMWLYGSGFPKSHDVSKAIDRARKDDQAWVTVGAWLKARRVAYGISTKQLCSLIGTHGEVNHGGAVSNWENGLSCPTWEQWQALKQVIAFDDEMDAEVWRLNGRKGQPGDSWFEREIITERQKLESWEYKGNRVYQTGGEADLVTISETAPATEAAREWQGWGTALKPACELICVARKPLSEGTVAANVLEHGTGALNIDASRVSTEIGWQDWVKKTARPNTAGLANNSKIYGSGKTAPVNVSDLGRWPANVAHDGSPEVLDVFARFGVSTGKASDYDWEPSHQGDVPIIPNIKSGIHFGDSGTAARFFYTAKAGQDERLDSQHPTVKPVALMEWLVRLVTPVGGRVLDPFAGTGSTLVACDRLGFDAVGIEQDAQTVADAHEKLKRMRARRMIGDVRPTGHSHIQMMLDL